MERGRSRKHMERKERELWRRKQQVWGRGGWGCEELSQEESECGQALPSTSAPCEEVATLLVGRNLATAGRLATPPSVHSTTEGPVLPLTVTNRGSGVEASTPCQLPMPTSLALSFPLAQEGGVSFLQQTGAVGDRVRQSLAPRVV